MWSCINVKQNVTGKEKHVQSTLPEWVQHKIQNVEIENDILLTTTSKGKVHHIKEVQPHTYL